MRLFSAQRVGARVADISVQFPFLLQGGRAARMLQGAGDGSPPGAPAFLTEGEKGKGARSVFFCRGPIYLFRICGGLFRVNLG